MATEGAIGRRRMVAIQRIEQRLNALSGSSVFKLPQHNRYGLQMLILDQLEAIAEQLEDIEIEPSPYDAMSFDRLKALARPRGGLMAGLKSKAALIAALKQADLELEKEGENASTL